MNNYVCIDKITGVEIPYSPNCRYKVPRDDWINPSNGYECKNIESNIKYHTRKDCNNAQIYSENVKYKKLDNSGTFYNYDDYYKPYLQRNDSRRQLLIILLIILSFLIITWFMVREINNDILGLDNNTKGYILSLIPVMSITLIFLCTFSITFCPFGVCSLDPDSHKFRRTPVAYIHKKLRLIKK